MRLAFIAVAAFCAATSATAQVTTNCWINGQLVTCNSYGQPIDQTIALRAMTPYQMQQQAAEVQIAQARARQVQAEAQEAQRRANDPQQQCKTILVAGVPYTHCE